VTEWRNPCGGKRWRIDPSGFIEVEGEGYPMFDAESDRYRYMMQTWQNWKSYFRSAAREFDVPVNYLLAIASIETGLWSDDPAEQATIGSYAGAVGVMQLMNVAKTHVELAFPNKNFGERTDPRQNIRMGAALLRDLLNKNSESFPEVSAIYNSGRKCSPGHNEWNLFADANYPRLAITWNNTALSSVRLNGVHWGLVALAAGGVGAAAVAYMGGGVFKNASTGTYWFRVSRGTQGLPLFW
jgi:hypothetical protein